MAVVIKTIKWITRILIYACYAAVIAMAAMTVYDVFMRYVFGKPNSGVTEWSQILLIVCMTAMAHALVEGRLTAVTTLVERFPKKLNIAVEIIMGVISFVFFVVVGWQLLKMVGTSRLFHEAYFVIKVPRWPMYLILGISFLASALATIAYVMEHIIHFKDPRDKNIFDENPDLAILAYEDDKTKKGGGDAQ